MTVEQILMKNLMRASASARRHPDGSEGHGRRREGRGHGHILDLLTESEGLSQQQLADKLGIRPQSVSEAISVMESRGFVRRQPSENDRRVALVFITEEGIAHRKEAAEERRERAKHLFSALNDGEKAELLRLLEKINAAVGGESREGN